MRTHSETDDAAPSDISATAKHLEDAMEDVHISGSIAFRTVLNPVDSQTETRLSENSVPPEEFRPPLQNWGIEVVGSVSDAVDNSKVLTVVEKVKDAMIPMYDSSEYLTSLKQSGGGNFKVFIWFVLD